MKAQEFKVGQVIKNGDVLQTVLKIVGSMIYTREATFNMHSLYAKQCVLVRDSKNNSAIPEKWKCKVSLQYNVVFNFIDKFKKLNFYIDESVEKILHKPLGGFAYFVFSDSRLNCVCKETFYDNTKIKEITVSELKCYYLTESKNAIKMKKYAILREQYQEIYDIACDTWKTKIEKRIKSLPPFTSIFEFNEEEIEEMLNAATVNQKPILEKIFPQYIEDNEKIELKGFINVYKDDVGKIYSTLEQSSRQAFCASERCICTIDLSKVPEEAIIKHIYKSGKQLC